MMNFTCAIVFTLALLLAESSALPATRRSSSATETGSSRSRTSGSSSGSGDGCDRALTEEERTTLISNIRSTIDGLESTLNGVNVWVALSATVGVYEYGDLGVNGGSSNCSALPSDYGYAIAKSVSFLQMFVRPVGDVLTNETVREVIERRTGFFDNYYTILGKLDTLTDDVYKLVKGYRNIHQCNLPGLPLADDNTVLNPIPPLGVRDPCYRDMVVDGVANELQKLIIDLEFSLNCFFGRS